MSQPDEIPTTADQLQKLRLLSDGELYQMACEFIKQHQTILNSQVVSLVTHTQDWDDLMDDRTGFVKHQADRDWTGTKSYYKDFFNALKNDLKNLRQRTENEWFPPGPEYDTSKKRRKWTDYFAILVAREFLQHLEAENMYKPFQ